MIKLENTEVLGWEAAIRGMRNPMNSWDKSDSAIQHGDDYWKIDGEYDEACRQTVLNGIGNLYDKAYLGPNDHKLMMNLAKAGSVDAKYRRMIVVTVDITAPLYWWKEFDTYKVGTVANSCSTMHKIHVKEFTLEDFSWEHLIHFPFDGSKVDLEDKNVNKEYCSLHIPGTDVCFSPEGVFELTVNMLNRARYLYLETKDKRYWWQMIQLLPSSYNQRRTVMLNYEVLAGIYPKRKDHKLDEWHDFCSWIKNLPYSEIITLEEIGN